MKQVGDVAAATVEAVSKLVSESNALRVERNRLAEAYDMRTKEALRLLSHRDELKARLKTLIEAASRVSFEWGETPADLADCDESFVAAWQKDFRKYVHELSAAIAEAKRS